MKNFIPIYKFIFNLIFIIILLACSNRNSNVHKFKSACKDFNKLSYSSLNIVEDKIIKETNNKIVTTISSAKHQNYITNNKNKYYQIIENLEHFIKSNPTNIFADDALFILANVYAILSFPGGDFLQHKKAIDTYEEFLKKYPSRKIEPWTKNCFKKTLWQKDVINSGFLKSSLPYSESIKLFLHTKSHIAQMYLIWGEYKEAEKILENLIKKYPDREVKHAINMNLDFIKQQNTTN